MDRELKGKIFNKDIEIIENTNNFKEAFELIEQENNAYRNAVLKNIKHVRYVFS